MLVQEGFIHLRNFLTEEEQVEIAKLSLVIKDRFEEIGDMKRFRIYDVLDTYPQHEFLQSIVVNRVMERCKDMFQELEVPTHLLFLRYEGKSKIGLHRDDGENDGIGLSPVISFSIGNACKFVYKDERKDTDQSIRLESGDVILFGGRSRYIFHSVQKIYQNTAPQFVTDVLGPNVRLNLTFRYAPNFLGRENEFRRLTTAATTPYFDSWKGGWDPEYNVHPFDLDPKDRK